MPILTASDGVRLHYEAVGEGPPLVLHTGGAGSGSMWRDAGYVDRLSARFRCILYDHRGHGASDQPQHARSHTMSRYISDVVELLDELQLDRTAFWGYSQGADIGLSAAALHPQRFSALVTTGAIGPKHLNAEENVAYANVIRQSGWDGLLERSKWTVSPWFQRQFDQTSAEMLALWYEAYGDWNTWELLLQVTAPVLMFVGELEDPEHWNDAGARRMKNARVVRMKGHDHVTAYERSDQVLPEAIEFLS